MVCTHENVCKKKEQGKNAKAGNPKVILGLCLRRGLEAEENASHVFPKFLALGLVLDLGSMISSTQHPASAFFSWILSWWLVWFDLMLLLLVTFLCFSQIWVVESGNRRRLRFIHSLSLPLRFSAALIF